MFLEVVFLSFQEGVQLSKISSIISLAIRLRSMVGMHVHIMKVVIGVVHVLAIIDLIEFSLAISDFPCISCADILVLTEIGTDKWAVGATVILADHHLGHACETEESKSLPAESHLNQSLVLRDQLLCNEQAKTPTEASHASLAVPEGHQLSSILVGHVVREEVSHGAIRVLMEIVVL